MRDGLLKVKKKFIPEATVIGWLLMCFAAALQAAVSFVIYEVCERVWCWLRKKPRKARKKHKKRFEPLD